MPDAAPPARGDDPLRTLALIAGVGLAGYLGYRYLYLPALQRQQMEDALRARMAAAGQPNGDPLQVLGMVGCQTLGAAYKIPPQLSAGYCRDFGEAVRNVVSNDVGFLKDVAHYGKDSVVTVVAPVYSAAKSVTGVVGSAAKSATHLFASIF